MITKDQLSAAMTRECDIAIHLFEKLPSNSYDYRPSPNQRSTTELLRYLSVCGSAALRWMDQGDYKIFAAAVEQNKNLHPEDFPAEMLKQKQEIAEYFAGITEEKLETHQASMPGGGSVPLQVAILNGPLKWLAGYKLQLFNYAKAAGNNDIGTANAWAGIDRPPPKKG